MVGREGFEPSKAEPMGLQPISFDRFDTDPNFQNCKMDYSEIRLACKPYCACHTYDYNKQEFLILIVMKKKQRPIGRGVGVIASTLLVLGSFLPWAKIDVLGFSETIIGMDGKGVIYVGMGITSLIVFLMKKSKVWAAIMFGVLGAALLYTDYAKLDSVITKNGGLSAITYGFYIVCSSAAGLIIGAIVTMVQERKKS